MSEKKKVDRDALCPKNVNMVDRDALCPKNVIILGVALLSGI